MSDHTILFVLRNLVADIVSNIVYQSRCVDPEN